MPTVELVTRLDAPLAELERRHQAEEGARLPEPACFAASAHASAEPSSDHLESAGQELSELFERAGLERFRAQAARFEGELACLAPAQVLYRGVLRAMGYTANTAGFERLAEALPFDALRTLAGPDAAGRPVRVQAALLGAAGLLPGQRGIVDDDGWPRALERAWDGFDGVRSEPLPASAWRWCQLGEARSQFVACPMCHPLGSRRRRSVAPMRWVRAAKR